MPLMQRLAIYGTGGFGREVLPVVREQAARSLGNPQIVFVDDRDSSPSVLQVPVVKLTELELGDGVIIAVGSGQARQAIAARCAQAGLVEQSIFSDTAIIGPGVEIGPGAVFSAYTIITASARVGRQFQCNIYSYVAHDCIVGDYVTFAPRVCCNGNVHIGEGAYIGTGAVIRNGTSEKPLRIGAGAIVGMGAVVTKDVADGATVIGNPAQPR